MKKNLSLIVATVLTITACHKKDDQQSRHLETNRSEILLPGHPAAVDSITITGNVAWTLSMDKPVDWLRLDISSGNGNAVVRFENIKDNNMAEEEVTVTLAALDGSLPSSSIKVVRKPYYKKHFSRLLGEDFRGNFISGIATNDGGVIMVGGAGRTLAGSSYFQTDGLIVRFNSEGELVWKKIMGGSLDDYFYEITATTDGQYMIAGFTKSSNGDIENGNRGDFDYWIVKLNEQGVVAWSRTFGGSNMDLAEGIAPMAGGRCMVTGWSLSDDGQVGTPSNNGVYKAWTMTVNADGNFGYGSVIANGGKSILSVQVLPAGDGGFLLAGNKARQPGLSNESWDGWLAKITPECSMVWQKTYEAYASNEFQSVIATSDGGYLLAGKCYEDLAGDGDIRLLKADANGNKLWEKKYGGNGEDAGSSLAIAAEGKYLLAAITSTNDGSVPDFKGHADGWVLKLDAQGRKLWAKTVGGSGLDHLYTIVKTTNNRYMLGGYTYSNDGDISGNRGSSDAWLFGFE